MAASATIRRLGAEERAPLIVDRLQPESVERRGEARGQVVAETRTSFRQVWIASPGKPFLKLQEGKGGR